MVCSLLVRERGSGKLYNQIAASYSVQTCSANLIFGYVSRPDLPCQTLNGVLLILDNIDRPQRIFPSVSSNVLRLAVESLSADLHVM